MVHASKFEAGPPSDWAKWTFEHPLIGKPTPGKLLLGELLGLSGMEVSLNSLAPGGALPFAHRHREHEELYLFLAGRGELRVDEETFEVGPGTCIRVSPAGARIWRNVGDEPLVYLVIQAAAGGSVRGISDGEPCPAPSDWPTRLRAL